MTKIPKPRRGKARREHALTREVIVESAAHLANTPETLGSLSWWLKEVMRCAGVSNGAQIARHVGCTRAAINKYLRNPGASVEAHLLFRIADYLNVDPRWLLEGVGSMTTPTTKAMVLSHQLEPFPERLKIWLEEGEYHVAMALGRIRWRHPGAVMDIDNAKPPG